MYTVLSEKKYQSTKNIWGQIFSTTKGTVQNTAAPRNIMKM